MDMDDDLINCIPQHIVLTEKGFQQLVEYLEEPRSPTASLVRLMNRSHAYRELVEQVQRKLNNGEGITDTELNHMISFYSELVGDLECLGPTWNLALTAARRELEAYKIIEQARSR